MQPNTRAALLAAGVISLFATGSAIADQKTVHYSPSDLQSEQGANVVYSRIRTAALRVCEPANIAVMRSTRPLHDCIDAAIGSAVRSIDSPALSSVYEADMQQRSSQNAG